MGGARRAVAVAVAVVESRRRRVVGAHVRMPLNTTLILNLARSHQRPHKANSVMVVTRVGNECERGEKIGTPT